MFTNQTALSMTYIFAKLKRKSSLETQNTNRTVSTGKWKGSGATEHCLECHGQFNWINLKTLLTEQQYHRRKIRELLVIKKAKKNRRRKVLNRNEGSLVKANP